MADNHFEAAPEGGIKLKDEQPKVQDVKAPEKDDAGLPPAAQPTAEEVAAEKAAAESAENRAEATLLATDDGEPEEDADPKVEADDDK
jgi:hypothetical protein